MLQVGIVGLANVGKSTLFNALRSAQGKLSNLAFVANYPFATIEPNVGIVPVPDERLEKLAAVTKAEEHMEGLPPIVPAVVQFVDIAGLVKGASEGAGLGNKFLSHIREVDLICQVVRAFPDENIIREGSTDPKSDMETINTELILADLQTMGKHLENKDNRENKEEIEKIYKRLNAGEFAGVEGKKWQLLTAKEMIYVFNVNSITDWNEVRGLGEMGDVRKRAVMVDAKLEADLSTLTQEEQKEYLMSLGIQDSGVNQLIRKCYERLGLVSFLTAGVKEVKAWTIRLGSTSLMASGVIHTDFMKNFIKAEIVSFEDFVEFGGWKRCRELGKVRLEGRDYVMKDGDMVEFKIGA